MYDYIVHITYFRICVNSPCDEYYFVTDIKREILFILCYWDLGTHKVDTYFRTRSTWKISLVYLLRLCI